MDAYNFRCPICGDSETNKSKKRGYIFKHNKRDALYYKCYNCNVTMSFSSLLKKIDKKVYKEYVIKNMQHYKSRPSTRQKPKNKIQNIKYESNPNLIKFKTDKYLKGLIKISDLRPEHIARKTLSDRLIPESSFSELYYSDDFMCHVNKFIPNKFKKPFKEQRLIIPLKTADGITFGMQGRSLNPNVEKRYRYMTIIFDESIGHKCFGVNKIKKDKPITVVEGPLDSLFLNNSIAACGSSINTAPADVYMLDNEPRNKVICGIMNSLLNNNKSVVIIEDEKFIGLDINDMILKGLIKAGEIEEFVKQNTYAGMTGLMKLKHWRKC